MWTSSRLARPAAAALLAAAALSLGCVEVALREGRTPPDYGAIPVPPGPEPTEGAIWAGETASGSFLFFDRKARGVGDLVTVLVDESFFAEGSASTSLGKTADISASLASDIGLADMLRQGGRRFFELLGVDPAGVGAAAGTQVNAVQSSATNEFEGDGETSREGRLGAVVTCRVVNELPGGIFHLRGRRQIVVNHELQLLTVEGLVRRDDISIRNIVPSTALAEARLTFDGIGVIDDKQRPSLLARLMDWVYPF
jgi:flagellar L-ring protein precursor FlgH